MNESTTEGLVFSKALVELSRGETNSKKALEKAASEASEILAGAHSKAAQIREESARKAEEERDAILAEERKKTVAERENIIGEAEKKTGGFTKGANFAQIARKIMPIVLEK